MPKYITATPALCGDGVTLSGTYGVPFLYESEQEAIDECKEDEEYDLYHEEVEQDANGDWIGTVSGKNWSEVARKQDTKPKEMK